MYGNLKTIKMSKFIELKNAVKSKILFRSEDGVDIFKGDKIYFVIKDKFLIGNGVAWDNELRHDYLHFSTRKAAENYIILNKPCLSINEVLTLGISKDGSWCKDLQKIVKSKLNE